MVAAFGQNCRRVTAAIGCIEKEVVSITNVVILMLVISKSVIPREKSNGQSYRNISSALKKQNSE